MKLNRKWKEEFKRRLAECLKTESTVQRVILFGSFLTSHDPNDLDVAVFQTSREAYLPLALKFRRLQRLAALADGLFVSPYPGRCPGLR